MTRNKHHSPKKVALFVVALLLISVVGYFAAEGIYEKYFRKDKITPQTHSSLEDCDDTCRWLRGEGDLPAKYQEQQQNNELNACLDSVHDWWNEAQNNIQTTEQQQNAIQLRQQYIDECELRHR